MYSIISSKVYTVKRKLRYFEDFLLFLRKFAKPVGSLAKDPPHFLFRYSRQSRS